MRERFWRGENLKRYRERLWRKGDFEDIEREGGEIWREGERC